MHDSPQQQNINGTADPKDATSSPSQLLPPPSSPQLRDDPGKDTPLSCSSLESSLPLHLRNCIDKLSFDKDADMEQGISDNQTSKVILFFSLIIVLKQFFRTKTRFSAQELNPSVLDGPEYTI